ncbi:MAG: extracellular solute-binding protein [Deltaproteobacteria bacterium]|nr:extracellular solute-binding protein [Deltaproteobacteria bacterium]
MRKKGIVLFLAQAVFCTTFLVSSDKSYGDAILEAAKKEGEVVFYGSMELPVSQKLGALFEKKYPFIKVGITRIASERMATRLSSEAQAGRARADVVHQSGFDFYGVLQKGVFESYNSSERSAFPAEYKDDKGYWTLNSATLNVIAYNTRLVPAGEVPKSFWDLTDPKWKGKIIMDENESKWMAGMISYYGEAKVMELLRKLATQDLQFRTGHTLMQTLVAAGERAIVGVAFANGVERLRNEGAPIEWVAAEPIIGLTFGFGLVKNSPHPNAGKLFVDFVLSREGQQAIADSNYYVPRKDVRSPIMKKVPPQVKVIPLSLEMAKRYNEYFHLYRKAMGIK